MERLGREAQDPDSLSDIMFTSGSTSKPKGVMLTHDMLLRSSFGSVRSRCHESGRRSLGPIPLYHAYLYVEGLLALQYMGGTLIMSRLHFNPKHILNMLEEFEANDMFAMGSIMQRLLATGLVKPERFPKLHTLQFATSAPDWLWEAVRQAFGVPDVNTGMGMTELSSCGVLSRPDTSHEYVKLYDGLPKNSGCAGDPDIGGFTIEYKIVNPETGEEMPRGKEGEIYYRGLQVTKGYYKNPEATAAAFTEDGWLKSGDLGDVTPDGYLTFRGRRGDMFKVNGENVSPIFLDIVIGQCELVEQVETVGVPDSRTGEAGVAFIDPKDYTEKTRDEILHYCQHNLSRFQIPKYYFFGDNAGWPRTATGKMSKKDLRKWALKLIEENKDTCRIL